MGRKVARKKKTADVLGSIFVGNTDASLGFPNSTVAAGQAPSSAPDSFSFFFSFSLTRELNSQLQRNRQSDCLEIGNQCPIEKCWWHVRISCVEIWLNYSN